MQEKALRRKKGSPVSLPLSGEENPTLLEPVVGKDNRQRRGQLLLRMDRK
jgi:hypothetical protein